jgi:hypothetical protein
VGESTATELAERVVEIATGLGIQTALIGAFALAAHRYVRATLDVDLATNVDPFDELAKLERALTDAGIRTRLRQPDDEDPIGGVLRAWTRENDDEDPLDLVEVVNFRNPLRLRRNPGADAIKRAIPLDAESKLRYVRLDDLVALKLYSGSRSDLADIVEVLSRNPDADLELIRETCEPYGKSDLLETLIAEASSERR